MARFVERGKLHEVAAELIKPACTVLDIGSGICPQRFIKPAAHVCVEPHVPYARRLISEHPEVCVLNCTWAEALELFEPASFDTVFLLDVIEHVEKDEALALITRTAALARRQVVVYTPLGFMPQGDGEDKDAWGMDGLEWQRHRSGWTPEDFEGWEAVVCEDHHETDAYGRELDKPFGAFISVLDVGGGYAPEEGNPLVRELTERGEQMRVYLDDRIRAADAFSEENSQLKDVLAAAERRIQVLDPQAQEADECRRQLSASLAELDQIKTSTSWHLTSPLRAASSLLRRKR